MVSFLQLLTLQLGPMALGAFAEQTLPRASTSVWQPAVGTSWQIVLDSAIKLSPNATAVVPSTAAVFDIDMFDNSAATVAALHQLGKKVICYFSAGSYEPGRPDSGAFNKTADLGKELDGWPGEYWLRLNSTNVRNIMAKRIAYAQQMGCDAVDPDNVDGYNNDNGLGLTQADSINFVEFLASTAATLGLAVGLKNAGDIIPSVVDVVQFSVNEQCAAYKECSTFAPFVQAGKPVFHIEYPDQDPKISTKTACNATGTAGFSTVIKKLSLNGWVEYCDGTTATTPEN